MGRGNMGRGRCGARRGGRGKGATPALDKVEGKLENKTLNPAGAGPIRQTGSSSSSNSREPEQQEQQAVLSTSTSLAQMEAGGSDQCTTGAMGGVEEEQVDEEILRTRNPLEHLLPQNVGSQPRPASDYGLSPEEMEKRVKNFEEFQKYFKEKVAVKSEDEIVKFVRVFQQASGSVKDLVQLGLSQEEIGKHVAEKLKNMQL